MSAIASIIISCCSGIGLFNVLRSRNVPIPKAIQFQCALVAFLSATLPIAISQARPSIIIYAIFLSVTTIDTAITFILPVATAILAGAHFSRKLIPSTRSVLALSVVIGFSTMIHLYWAHGFWQNPLMFTLPCLFMYILAMLLTSFLLHWPKRESAAL